MPYQHTDKRLELFDIESSLPLFKRFIEFMPDAIIGVRENGRIAFANERAEQLFGAPPNGLLHRGVEDLMPEAFRQAHREYRSGYYADPRIRPMNSGLEIRGLHFDGSEFPIDISLSAIQSGRSTIALAVIRKVTSRLQTDGERNSSPELAAGRR